MPQLVGAAIIAIGASAGVTVSATVAGTLGSIIVTGALVGAQLLLAPTPDIPKPADGKLLLKQSIPPVIYGYGRSRIAGAYAAYDLKGSTSYDVIAIHQGRIGGFVKFYLNDDVIEFESGEDGFVASKGSSRYAGDSSQDVQIYWREGLPTETAYAPMVAAFPASWTAAHRGDGVASILLICSTPPSKVYSQRFPFGLPKPSAVVDLTLCWDPRDPAQDPDNEATWTFTTNPFRQLLHFYCHCPAGFREPVDQVYTPAAGYWLAAMDVCDAPTLRGDGTTTPHFQAGGHFTSETPRKSVVEALLRSCDGWLQRQGDGSVVVYAGAWYEPTLILDDDDIYDLQVDQNYVEDEDINQILVKVVSADHDYNEVEADPWIDQPAIDAGAILVTKDAIAEWSPDYRQSRELTKIEFDRVRAKLRGTLVCGKFGENLKKRRFVWLNSESMTSTRMVPIEIVDLVDNSFQEGTWSVTYQSVDPARYTFDRLTDEGRRPAIPNPEEELDVPVPPAPTLGVIRQMVTGGGVVAMISATSPPVEGWPDLTLTGHCRKSGETAWRKASASDDNLQVFSGVVDDGLWEFQTAYIGGGGGEGDYSPTATITVVSDDVAPATPADLQVALSGSTATATLRAASNDSPHTQRLEFRAGTPTTAPLSMTVLSTQDATSGATRTFSETLPAGVRRYYGYALNGSGVRSIAPAGPVDVKVAGQTFSDTFSYSDGALTSVSTFWTRIGGTAGAASVASGVVTATATAQTIYNAPDTYSVTHYAEAEVRFTAGSNSSIVAVAIGDSSNFMSARYTAAGAWQVLRREGGTTTTVTTTTASLPAVGTIVRFERRADNTVVLLVGGTQIGAAVAVTTALQGFTKAGFVVNAAGGALLDNFKAGVL